MHDCLAMITARGGIKHIPKKITRDFCGKSIIVYNIVATLQNQLFSTALVFTDLEEIVDFAGKYGAEILFMCNETTSSDYAIPLLKYKAVTDGRRRKIQIVFECNFQHSTFLDRRVA